MRSKIFFGLLAVILSSTSFAQDEPPEQQLPPLTVRPMEDPIQAPVQDPFSFVPGDLGQITLDREGGALKSNRSIFDDPRNITSLSQEDISRKNPKDMKEALQQEVGILIQSTGRGQAAPFVRGLTGQQVLLMVDGVRMNHSIYRLGPNQYFNTIDPGMVERIEVVRGPQASLWGFDAIGGVINVVTRSANIGYTTDYLTGEFVQRFTTQDSGSYSRINVEGSMQGRGFFGGGSYLNVHDLDIGGDFGRQEFTSYSQYAGDIRFDNMLADDAKLTVALQHHEQEGVPRSDRFPSRITLFEPQLGTLVRSVINKEATDEEVTKAVEEVEKYVSKNEAAKKQLGTIASRVANSGKLENYGIKSAQKAIQKWAKDYGPSELKKNR